MLVPRRYMARHFDSENIYRIHSRNINFLPELSTKLLFENLCLCFFALYAIEKPKNIHKRAFPKIVDSKTLIFQKFSPSAYPLIQKTTVCVYFPC